MNPTQSPDLSCFTQWWDAQSGRVEVTYFFNFLCLINKKTWSYNNFFDNINKTMCSSGKILQAAF